MSDTNTQNKKMAQFRLDHITRSQIEEIALILASANPLETIKVSKTRVVEIAIEKLYKDLKGDNTYLN